MHGPRGPIAVALDGNLAAILLGAQVPPAEGLLIRKHHLEKIEIGSSSILQSVGGADVQLHGRGPDVADLHVLLLDPIARGKRHGASPQEQQGGEDEERERSAKCGSADQDGEILAASARFV